jgi:hypothetical protein
MLRYLRGAASERKRRLFAVACCRLIWHLLTDEHSRRTVDIAERYADGAASEKELRQAEQLWTPALQGVVPVAEFATRVAEFAARAAQAVARRTGYVEAVTLAAEAAAAQSAEAAGQSFWDYRQAALKVESRTQCDLFRDIFGNPFRPVSLQPSWVEWNDGTVLKIALAVYRERAFDRLPILADALQDAGCDEWDILRHCQEPGEHVRGCWVIDLLLGKA